MTRSARVLTGLTHTFSIRSEQAQSLWICDRTLADTYDGFFGLHRRHGSTYLGPLEARRRAQGRKATTVTHDRIQSAQPPEHLFNPKPWHLRWWDSGIRELDYRGAQLRYQPWSPPAPPQPLPIVSSSKKSTSPGALGLKPETRTAILKELETAETVYEVEQILTRNCVNLHEFPAFADPMIERVVGEKDAKINVSEYLVHPTLNPTGSSTYYTCVRAILKHDRKDLFPAVLDAIVRATELGLLDSAAITNILLSQELHAQASSIVLNFVERILDKVAESQVLQMGNFNEAFLPRLISLIIARPFDQNIMRLIHKLSTYSDKSADVAITNAVLQSLKCVSHRPTESEQWVTEIISFCNSTGFGYKLAPAITTILLAEVDMEAHRTELRAPFHPFTGDEPISHAGLQDTRKHYTPLELWARVLAQFGESQGETTVFETHDILQPETGLAWLVNSWTHLSLHAHLSDRRRRRYLQKRSQDLLTIIDPGTQLNQEQIRFEAIRLITSTALPLCPELFGGIFGIPSNKICSDVVHAELEEVRECIDQQNPALFVDSRSCHLARTHFGDAFKMMCESINADIDLFRAQARVLLALDNQCHRVIQGLLQQNVPLNVALAYGWKPQQRASLLPAEARGRFPGQVKEMIADFAVSCACSPMLTRRVALRRVDWFLRFLRAHGAPDQTSVARALWRAAITRSRGGQSERMVTWALKLVNTLQGNNLTKNIPLATRAASFEQVEQELFESNAPWALDEYESATEAALALYSERVAVDPEHYRESIFASLDRMIRHQETPERARKISGNNTSDTELNEKSDSDVATADTPRSLEQAVWDGEAQNTESQASLPEATIPWHQFTRSHAMSTPSPSQSSRGDEQYAYRFTYTGPYLDTPEHRRDAQIARTAFALARKEWEEKRSLPDYTDKRFNLSAAERAVKSRQRAIARGDVTLGAM